MKRDTYVGDVADVNLCKLKQHSSFTEKKAMPAMSSLYC